MNSTIVTGTAGGDAPLALLFSAPVLTTAHAGVVFKVRDEAADLWRHFVATTIVSAQRAVGWWVDDQAPPMWARTLLWEEQAVSGARGSFNAVTQHQGRLVLGGARDAGSALWASRAGRFRNFDLGTAADADGIAVTLAGGVRDILHVVSAGPLFVFTDRGVVATPAADTKPLTPLTARFQTVADDMTASAVPPLVFDGGVAFVRGRSGTVNDLVIDPSGNTVAVSPLSLGVQSSLGIPCDGAVYGAVAGRPEQYAFWVGLAGHLSVLLSVRAQQIAAWATWTTQGHFKAVASVNGRVFVAVERGERLFLEVFDERLSLDAAVTGEASLPIAPHLAEMDAHVMSPLNYYGVVRVQPGGGYVLTLPPEQTGPFEVGLGFDWWIDPLPVEVELPGDTLLNRRLRLVKTSLNLLGARAAEVQGERMVLRRDGELVEVAPSRSQWVTARHLGWREPDAPEPAALRITRDAPLPLTVLSMIREVKIG